MAAALEGGCGMQRCGHGLTGREVVRAVHVGELLEEIETGVAELLRHEDGGLAAVGASCGQRDAPVICAGQVPRARSDLRCHAQSLLCDNAWSFVAARLPGDDDS